MADSISALAPFVLPAVSCLVVLVAIATMLIVKKTHEKAKKKPAQTAPSGESESPEASIEPPDEEQGDIGPLQPRVRPPLRLSRTPVHSMTHEQLATFTSAIREVITEGQAAAKGA